jgi:hypothetical protein
MSLNAGDDNMRGNSAKHVSGVAGSLVSMAIFVWPVMGAEIAAPIPDLSGQWGRNAFNFEVLSSGPHPVTNLRRTGDDAARAIIVGDPIPLVGDYTNPILKPEAAEVVRKKGEYSASGHDFPDPSNQCAAHSPPYLFTIMLGMQMLQGKDEITILYTQDNQVRRVRMNERHPAHLMPSAMGHSVGHYEGDTLVVDTVGVKLQPFTMVDRFGTPQSDALHLVERYRLIDARQAQEAQDQHEKTAGRVNGEAGVAPFDPDYGKGLQVQVTIEDPKIFTTPWSANVTYRRVKRQWAESVCAENNTDVLHQGFEHVPTTDKPDF